MPTPTHPIIIGIKGSSALSVGEYAKVTNFTTGGTIKIKAGTGGECIINPSDEGLTWNEDDILSIELNGRLLGSSQYTITKKGVKATITASADTNSPAVSL